MPTDRAAEDKMLESWTPETVANEKDSLLQMLQAYGSALYVPVQPERLKLLCRSILILI